MYLFEITVIATEVNMFTNIITEKLSHTDCTLSLAKIYKSIFNHQIDCNR